MIGARADRTSPPRRYRLRRVMLPTTTRAVATSTKARTDKLEIVKFHETAPAPGTCVLNRGGFQMVQRRAWLETMPETSKPHQGRNPPIKAIAAAKMETGFTFHEVMLKLSIESNQCWALTLASQVVSVVPPRASSLISEPRPVVFSSDPSRILERGNSHTRVLHLDHQHSQCGSFHE